ncbi:MAG: T9SS type A sorting domain-containing protein [Bacteroidetes bacterium]|nr:T9SS type A sorting domain-containing protein [Bacteroidota bacterium]
MNRDGKNDLLVGERSGVLNYFENTGTSSSPIYNLNTSNFGGVNVLQPGAVAGYSAPLLFDNGAGYELLVGSDKGAIYHFTNIDGNLTGNFTLSDSLFQGIQELKRVTLSKADIDGDSKYDLLTGCNAGGFRLYSQYTSSSISQIELPQNFTIHPNPAVDFCRIHINGDHINLKGVLSVSDISGKMIKRLEINSGMVQLNTSDLTSGMYLVHFNNGFGVTVQKLMKQ